MSIAAEAPRGGVVEYIGDASYTFILRNAEIERFEDKHRGIFELWDGMFRTGRKPTSKEVRDIVALGLVGSGKKDNEADLIVSKCTPADLLRLYAIAQAVVGVAFMPDVLEEQKKNQQLTSDQQDLTSEA